MADIRFELVQVLVGNREADAVFAQLRKHIDERERRALPASYALNRFHELGEESNRGWGYRGRRGARVSLLFQKKQRLASTLRHEYGLAWAEVEKREAMCSEVAKQQIFLRALAVTRAEPGDLPALLHHGGVLSGAAVTNVILAQHCKDGVEYRH